MADHSAASVSNANAPSGSDDGPMMPGPDDIGPEASSGVSNVEDLGRSRDYRNGEVRGKKLPTYLVRSLGLVSHMDTPREEWAALAIAGRLSDVTESNDAEAIRYRNRHSGNERLVEREEGTIQKSRQSFVEDIRRRIWKKCAVPGDREQREAWTEDFERHYDRSDHGFKRLERNEHLVNEGPVVEAEHKPWRDRNGRRWTVNESFRRQPDGDPQRPSVRCTGPEPEIDFDETHVDVLDALERIVAHNEDLHDGFTAGWKAEERGGQWRKHQSKTNARQSHLWTARNGTDRPQYVSVGRWRPDEIEEDDLKGERAVFVPWIIFDIDADTKERCAALAFRLVQLLSEHLTDEQLDDVICSFTGSTSIHVRVPAGFFGNRLFRDAGAAAQSLSEFADGLCEGHPELREAIDDRLFHPSQVCRMIGSTYEEDTDPPDNSSWRPWLIQRLSIRSQVDGRGHAAEIADNLLTFLRDRHLNISDVDLDFSGTRPVTVHGAEDQTPNTGRVVACTANEFLDHGAGPLWARSQCGAHRPFDIPNPTSAEFVESLARMLDGEAARPPSTHNGVGHSVGKQPSHPPSGEYERALEVDVESEKWGRDVDKPGLKGRNRAAFTISLVQRTHAESVATAWSFLQRWNEGMSEPLCEGELRKTFRSAGKYV